VYGGEQAISLSPEAIVLRVWEYDGAQPLAITPQADVFRVWVYAAEAPLVVEPTSLYEKTENYWSYTGSAEIRPSLTTVYVQNWDAELIGDAVLDSAEIGDAETGDVIGDADRTASLVGDARR